MGGKEILIKAVAQAIPLYSMSCFKLSKGLCESLNSLLRNFWWGCRDGRRKTCWVSWEEMSTPKNVGGMGFRDFELFNLALLARQAWRIIQNPETLSAQVLKAVYFPDSDLLNATLGSHPSKIWRAIVEGRDVLKQGLIRRIGTGENTDAWHDNWLPRDGALRPVACLKEDPPIKVSDFIDETAACWNLPKLQEFFQPMDIELIRSIPVCTRRLDDFWSWHYERTGVFSVRSAYRMLAETRRRREAWLEGTSSSSDHRGEEKSWKMLWHIQVPSKIKVFLWRLAKQSIPTADVRHRRNMADNSSCVLCGVVDSWRHSLLECVASRSVWALAPEAITEHMDHTRETDAKQWIFTVVETLQHDDLIRCMVTMWAIWFARRKLIHEDIFQSPLSTNCFVENFLKDLGVTTEKKQLKPAHKMMPTSSKVSGWCAPPEGYAKIHVDAAVKKDQEGGAVAAVCRSSNGTYLGASAVVVHGITDPGTLEALACREAIALAQDLSLDRVVVSSDCLEVISSMKSANLGRFSTILKEIKASTSGFSVVSFIHEKRELNREAHSLARGSTSLNVGRHIWLLETPDTICIPIRRCNISVNSEQQVSDALFSSPGYRKGLGGF